MDPLEYRYTWLCSIEGDDYDGYDDTSHPRCIPDLLWWARLPRPGSADADSGDVEETLYSSRLKRGDPLSSRDV